MGSDPGHGPTPLISHAVVASHVQNRGKWACMLAQGQSSSPKKEEEEEEEHSIEHCFCDIPANDA